MKSHKRILTCLLAATVTLLVLTPGWALAKPKVDVKQTVTKEIKVVENGQPVVRVVPADEVFPGETIRVTLAVTNQGDEPATALVLDNPIPAEATYVNGSAKGSGTEITFSIDQGKTYKKPALLTYEITLPDGHIDKRVASPEEYTHLRWALAALPAGSSIELEFSATINK